MSGSKKNKRKNFSEKFPFSAGGGGEEVCKATSQNIGKSSVDWDRPKQEKFIISQLKPDTAGVKTQKEGKLIFIYRIMEK